MKQQRWVPGMVVIWDMGITARASSGRGSLYVHPKGFDPKTGMTVSFGVLTCTFSEIRLEPLNLGCCFVSYMTTPVENRYG